MSQVAPVPNVPTGSTPTSRAAHGAATLSGRVVGARRIKTQNGPLFVTILKLPAADEFTSPQTVEIRSKGPLGEKGEVVTVGVRIGGYGRSYTKKETDEMGDTREVTVQTADNSLTAVE